ncbi:hypothetical protein PUMCH_004366 [Australozyma saopauloensis]|uniref:rRNA adenine N(6)-methyltransferase n=1 Tax=Australozyma saopauloensis TaxID=291208 RepID=A0AAX4HEL0_9ASCO|nr:hypothetical protein PUMCH_004366 [[Candida] saopauloensis]
MNLRSWNPKLLHHFQSITKFKNVYNFKYLSDPETCQKLIDRMDLRRKYPKSKGNLDIVDVFPGPGILSSMINQELQPRNHVILEKEKDHVSIWDNLMKTLKDNGGNQENFRFVKEDGYEWETYNRLIEEKKIITPKVENRSRIHDELLIVANLTSSSSGEPVLAQWIQCCAHQNWLQKYGRVRMLLLVRHDSSLKFLSTSAFPKRNRAALKRDVYTESHLLAVSDIVSDTALTPGEGFDPHLLFEEQPIVISNGAVAPSPGDLSVIEIIPRGDLEGLNIFDIDHLCQSLMYKSQLPVAEALSMVGLGASEALCSKIRPEILAKIPRHLTRDEFLEIYNAYTVWPFKATFEDTIDILMEDSRSY